MSASDPIVVTTDKPLSSRMPVVAICGRPNVGKSSLLNALVGRRISIVQDQPGVTRDRVATPLPVDGRYVELVDTGGFGFVDPDQLTEHINHQIELAMSRANLVLLVVDCQDGLTAADQEIATLLRRKGIKTVLVANKADGPRADVALSDFARLGFGTPIGVSALRERNIDQVIDAIGGNLDLSNAPTEVPEPEMMLAIVGKRNAGKSTLVNAIAGLYEDDPERVIVSEVPGTTRDSVDVRFEKDGHTLVVIDTAGVRKKRHMVTNDVEFYSFHRAERSIRRADVVLMLIDANEPVSEPDKKLAQYIFEQHKPVILVVNKWDLARDALRERRKGGEALRDEDFMEEYREYLNTELRNLDFAPIAFVTAKEGKNVQVVLDLAQHLFKQANERLSTSRLNQAVRQILQERQPSTSSGRRARIYYATQTGVAPPEIVLFVNNIHYFSDAYQRFIINRMRDLLPYPEVPIKLVIRERQHGGARGGKPVPLEDVSDEEMQKAAEAERRERKAASAKGKATGVPRRSAGKSSTGKRAGRPKGRNRSRRR
jgi:GTP-binding protein